MSPIRLRPICHIPLAESHIYLELFRDNASEATSTLRPTYEGLGVCRYNKPDPVLIVYMSVMAVMRLASTAVTRLA
jgi:hypothetical protein